MKTDLARNKEEQIESGAILCTAVLSERTYFTEDKHSELANILCVYHLFSQTPRNTALSSKFTNNLGHTVWFWRIAPAWFLSLKRAAASSCKTSVTNPTATLFENTKQSQSLKDWQCTYNVILWYVRTTMVAVGQQKVLHILCCVCVCVLP